MSQMQYCVGDVLCVFKLNMCYFSFVEPVCKHNRVLALRANQTTFVRYCTYASVTYTNTSIYKRTRVIMSSASSARRIEREREAKREARIK